MGTKSRGQVTSMVGAETALLSMPEDTLDSTIRELEDLVAETREDLRAVLLRQPHLLLVDLDPALQAKVMCPNYQNTLSVLWPWRCTSNGA